MASWQGRGDGGGGDGGAPLSPSLSTRERREVRETRSRMRLPASQQGVPQTRRFPSPTPACLTAAASERFQRGPSFWNAAPNMVPFYRPNFCCFFFTCINSCIFTLVSLRLTLQSRLLYHEVLFLKLLGKNVDC